VDGADQFHARLEGARQRADRRDGEARDGRGGAQREGERLLLGCVLAEMATATGHSADEIHDAMCERFLPNESKRVEFFNKQTGEVLTVDVDHRRSSKLTGKAFYEFVEQVRQFAAEFLDVQTEDPNPEYWRRAA
jgi:hypothetical protein